MKKNILSVLIVIVGIFIFGVIPGFSNAKEISSTAQNPQTLSSVQYPIKELGNCQSKENCSVYCDKPENSNACLTFAGQHNLMSSNEVAVAKKFIDNGMVGPGGCKGQDKCSQYCGNSEHLEECTNFSEKNGMMSDQQLKDSKKVLTAMKNGLKPPACSGPEQCNTYCSSPEHMEECMTFSLAAGIVPDDQKAQMQKALDAIRQGIKPPACQPAPPPDQPGQSIKANQPAEAGGLESCNTYCSNSSHTEECMTFTLAAGMVPDDQKAQMQKTLDVIKQGIKPPACQPNQPAETGQGLQSCDEYCADSSHVEECVKFSVAIGNMTETQAQSAIKTGGKGPGGCIGKDVCDTFCNNSDNQDTCFNFAKDNGMIPEADLQKMQDSQQKMKDAFSSIPPEVVDCLTSSVGADVVEKMKTGSVIGRQFGDSINQCFQKANVQENPQNQNKNDQNQQNQPWADMCKPDANGKPTALACVDGDGKFVESAKVGSDGKPVCSASSTAKCGDYSQNNQQNQNQPGQQNQKPQQNQQGQPGDKFQPGPGVANPGNQQMPQQVGPGGCKGPEECKIYCESHQEDCKNFYPAGDESLRGSGPQIQQQVKMQPGQQCEGENCQSGPLPGQPNQPEQSGTNISGTGPCGTGPGTCSGIVPDDINLNGGNGAVDPNQGQGNQPNQPGRMQPQQQLQLQQPPSNENQPLPPLPTSFINANSLIGSLIDVVFNFLTKH